MRRAAGPTGLTLDLYHLDSAYVAWRSKRDALATFDLSVRHHPFGGGYLLAAGLEPALRFALSFAFAASDLEWLRERRDYEDAFFDELAGLRFTGDIWAMPEGTVAFAGEPLLRVTAPFTEALLLESGLLHEVNLSTLVATKAARIVDAASGRPVAEFGLRRAHEPYTAVRSAWIGGVASTSFVDAARRFDLPATGTIPHALVQAYPSEREAFEAVATSLPEYTLLLDTYDVDRATRLAVEVALDARARHGHELRAVRLDSGDLAGQARRCRAVLDEAGLTDVKILASGDLDEFRISELLAGAPPIDAFGVGTAMATGAGSAARGIEGGSLSSVYKLVWYEGPEHHAAIKHAGEKSTWPGVKQVHRIGAFERDVIALKSEDAPGAPLLERVVSDGEPVAGHPPLDAIRTRAAEQLAALPDPYRRLTDPAPYPVERSAALRALRDRALTDLGLDQMS